MVIYRIDTLGDVGDPELVIIDHAPEGLGVKYSRLVRGKSVAADFPPDAELHMSEERPGLKLASLLGNVKRFLIVHREVKEVIEAAFRERCPTWPVEYFSFTLVNHRGRSHSRDYYFINPLGAFECVDHEASSIDYFEGDPNMVLGINRLVLDPRKLVGGPPLFRLAVAHDRYLIDAPLHDAIVSRGFTNFSFLELSPSNVLGLR